MSSNGRYSGIEDVDELRTMYFVALAPESTRLQLSKVTRIKDKSRKKD